jgi:hypothetical protein
MLGDQTMAEGWASGGAYRDTLRFTRPAFAATDLLVRIGPMIAAAGQRLGRHLDDPARQIEPALVAGTGPWSAATR